MTQPSDVHERVEKADTLTAGVLDASYEAFELMLWVIDVCTLHVSPRGQHELGEQAGRRVIGDATAELAQQRQRRSAASRGREADL